MRVGNLKTITYQTITNINVSHIYVKQKAYKLRTSDDKNQAYPSITVQNKPSDYFFLNATHIILFSKDFSTTSSVSPFYADAYSAHRLQMLWLPSYIYKVVPATKHIKISHG